MATQKTPIQRACEIVGSKKELARILNITPSMIGQVISGHRPLPVRFCVAIEVATKKAVTRCDLRPDDWEQIWPDSRSRAHKK